MFSIAIGMLIEIIVVYRIQKRNVIDDLLVILIGCLQFAMPTKLSAVMIIGYSDRENDIARRMIAIDEQMLGLYLLRCDKIGTLTLSKLD